MNNKEGLNLAQIRIIVFAAVAILHLLFIMFVAFKIKTTVSIPEPLAGVMKLVDVEERIPPPERPPDTPYTNTQEVIAQTMIETDEAPPPVIIPLQSSTASEQIDYLPQHRVSVLPVLPEAEIRRAIVYPPIAQRSGIEGTVYLELFIDNQGFIRNIQILREDPAGRGFGEAAINALKGLRAKPAEANAVPVAVRFRFPIRFTLK